MKHKCNSLPNSMFVKPELCRWGTDCIDTHSCVKNCFFASKQKFSCKELGGEKRERGGGRVFSLSFFSHSTENLHRKKTYGILFPKHFFFFSPPPSLFPTYREEERERVEEGFGEREVKFTLDFLRETLLTETRRTQIISWKTRSALAAVDFSFFCSSPLVLYERRESGVRREKDQQASRLKPGWPEFPFAIKNDDEILVIEVLHSKESERERDREKRGKNSSC